MIEPLNPPSVAPLAAFGLVFVADIDGESLVLGGSSNDLSASATEYNMLTGVSSLSWKTPETDRFQLGQVCVLRKMYVELTGTPGAGNSYAFRLRLNEGDSDLLVTLSDSETTDNNTADEITIASDDTVGLQVIPTSTPTVRVAKWGLVCFIAPAAAASLVLLHRIRHNVLLRR